MSFKRSGGIILAYRNEYEKYISELPKEYNFIFWFKISKELTGCDEDSIHGIVYISPENSKYASIDALSEIENKLQNVRKNYKYVCLHGDYNSRTSEESDFIDFDRELCNNENVEHLFIDLSNVYMLEELGFALRRANEDKVINQYGRKLLDFCKYNDVFIVNGRIGEDQKNSKFTCKNISVVDCIISSPEYLKHIASLQVLEFSKLLSDVHCPISICLDNVKQSSPNIVTNHYR